MKRELLEGSQGFTKLMRRQRESPGWTGGRIKGLSGELENGKRPGYCHADDLALPYPCLVDSSQEHQAGRASFKCCSMATP